MLCHDFRIDFNFNPRSYKRSDEVDQWVRLSDVEISIHAPTRGATSVSLWHGAALLFQSTLLQEERPCPLQCSSQQKIFQSTLLQEERQDLREKLYE